MGDILKTRSTETENSVTERLHNKDNVTAKLGRSVYIQVNLESVTHNINIMRSRCLSDNTGIIGIVKAGAYGHGSIAISQHLKNIGVERLAVATIDEGIHLRQSHIKGPIHVLGNVQSWEMTDCLRYSLIPTLCDVEAVEGMGKALRNMKTESEAAAAEMTNCHSNCQSDDVITGSVNIKVDSGMSRNGCQPYELPQIIQKCQDEGVNIDAIFTHFADSWGNAAFSKKQLEVFLKITEPYKSLGIKRHVSNSGAILRHLGTDLDFVRPGISMLGMPPDDASPEFQAFGLRPIASIIGYPTLVKTLPEGRKVGYGCTFTTSMNQSIATFPIGYADGYWRHLSNKGVIIRNKTGERCPVVGRVSMDAITAVVPQDTSTNESFTLLSADYDPVTSVCGIADMVGTISYEVLTRFSVRLPRLYTYGDKRLPERPALSNTY